MCPVFEQGFFAPVGDWTFGSRLASFEARGWDIVIRRRGRIGENVRG